MKFKKLINGFTNLNDTNIKSFFIIDNETYEVERFQTSINQDVDHKGQPQSEIKGGQFYIVLKQTVSRNIYDWAKRFQSLKSGVIKFETETFGTVFKVSFNNAVCISLNCNINEHTGTITNLVISCEELSFYDSIKIENKWNL